MLTYEAVEEIDLEFTRPIIILGPMKVYLISTSFVSMFLGVLIMSGVIILLLTK